VGCTNPSAVTRTGFSLLAGLVPVLVSVRLGDVRADPLAVRTSGALPFSTSELESALSLRAQLATERSARRLEAAVSSDGAGVRIELQGRERRIALDGQHGAEAARLVAFAILDLAGDQLDPPDAPPAPREARSIDRAARSSIDGVARPVTRRDPAWAMTIWGAVGSRSEATLELGVAVRGPLRVTLAGGAGPRTTTTVMDRSVTLRTVPVRAGLAWRAHTPIGPVDLRASALALIADAKADRSATDIVGGGGVAATWVVPIGGFAVLVGGGADGFANARDYRVGGIPVVATDRIAWWAGVGIAREATR